MQTNFSPAQLADPDMASSEGVIRKCVHCGFCLATCPTYTLLGDELDSPRGRIYLMKDMLENERAPGPEVVKHVDRCLSCLSCMTTCPSGVNYMHLVDHARAYIEERYRRPMIETALRGIIAFVLPYPRRLRAALALARLAKPFRALFAYAPPLKPVAAMLALAPERMPGLAVRKTVTAKEQRRGRVVLMQGCVEPALRPEIGDAATRLLSRAGFEVSFAREEGCCGALEHHMGRQKASHEKARRNIDAWTAEMEKGSLDAILITASGCGTTIKDYGFMFRDDPLYAEKAARVSALARDISEFLDSIELPAPVIDPGMSVAYHSACSLQHGQKVTALPQKLLRKAGYNVTEPAESHMCCGSAGVYNILQSDIADKLGARKAAALTALQPDIIATGNVGCAVQIGARVGVPVVHTVELIDWATGGPIPAAIAKSREKSTKILKN